jgi:hypothetical protein
MMVVKRQLWGFGVPQQGEGFSNRLQEIHNGTAVVVDTQPKAPGRLLYVVDVDELARAPHPSSYSIKCVPHTMHFATIPKSSVSF